MSINLKKAHIVLLFKWIIVLSLALVIYFQIFKDDNWEQMYFVFWSQLDAGKWYYLLLVLLLMPINWLLEVVKWRLLVLQFEKISFKDALKSILLGIVMALVTPARIGEYAGRLSIVKEKAQSVGATLIGSIAQNIITLAIGLLAIYTFLDRFVIIDQELKSLYLIIVMIGVIGLTWLYFHMNRIIGLLTKVKFIKKYISKISNLKKYKAQLLIFVLGISFLRYSVYLLQYFLLLLFFGIEADSIVLFAGIAILFLIQSGIPLPPMLSIFARGELAILIWSNISDNSIAAVAVSFALWFINLIIPALLGLLVMFRTNLFEKTKSS